MNEQLDIGPQSGSIASMQAAQLQGELTTLINAIVKGIDDRLAAYDVDAANYAVLAALFTNGPTEISGLRRMIPIDPGRMSRMVSALANRNLVRKIRLQSDQRVVRVELTSEGEAVAPALIGRIESFYTEFMNGLSDNDLSECMTTIETLTANALASSRNWEVEHQGSRPGPGSPQGGSQASPKADPPPRGRSDAGVTLAVAPA